MDANGVEALAAVAVVFGSSLSSAAMLGFWMSRQFSSAKKELYVKIDEHEREDQRRHEDNLGEFRRIYIGLTQLGWRNGLTDNRK
jgi:hypothetical protein